MTWYLLSAFPQKDKGALQYKLNLKNTLKITIQNNNKLYIHYKQIITRVNESKNHRIQKY